VERLHIGCEVVVLTFAYEWVQQVCTQYILEGLVAVILDSMVYDMRVTFDGAVSYHLTSMDRGAEM
jgi:hypothetical protein